MRNTLAWVLSATLLATGALAAIVAAQDDDDRRRVDVMAAGTEAQMELERTDDADEEKVELHFSTTDGLMLLKASTTDDETVLTRDLEVQLGQLIEYRDSDGDGAYDDGEPIVTTWLLSSESPNRFDVEPSGTVVWDPLVVRDVSEGSVQGKEVIARANLAPSAGMVPPLPVPVAELAAFQISFALFGEAVTHEGSDLAPTDVKVDLLYENYPFGEESTKLGLVFDARAEDRLVDTPQLDVVDVEGVATSGDLGDASTALSFAWATEALVDNDTRDVKSTELEREESSLSNASGDEQEIRETHVLAYARGDNISHDPVAGARFSELGDAGGINLGDEAGAAGTGTLTATIVGVLVGAVLLVALAAYLYRHRGPKGRRATAR